MRRRYSDKYDNEVLDNIIDAIEYFVVVPRGKQEDHYYNLAHELLIVTGLSADEIINNPSRALEKYISNNSAYDTQDVLEYALDELCEGLFNLEFEFDGRRLICTGQKNEEHFKVAVDIDANTDIFEAEGYVCINNWSDELEDIAEELADKINNL